MHKAYFLGGTQDLSVRMLRDAPRQLRFPVYPRMEARALAPCEPIRAMTFDEEVYINVSRLPDGALIYVPEATL